MAMMAADVLVLREFESHSSLAASIPHGSQRNLFATNSDVDWTSFDASDELFVVGTKCGTLFIYDRTTKTLKHNLAAKQQDEITKLKIIRSIDTVVAAGRASGSISIFQLLSMSRGQYEEVRVFLIMDIHPSAITCLEWSQNAMKLFSGDNSGVVACTEIDYLLNSSRSYVVHTELPELSIVQLNYNYRKLLVSSLERSFIVHVDDGNKVTQIGRKQRKRPGTFGAVFMPGFLLAKDAIIYAARPGLRLWKARLDGAVEQTHLLQDDITGNSLNVHPLHEVTLEHVTNDFQRLHQFGLLYIFCRSYLLSFQGSSLYVIDPDRSKIVCYHSNLGEIVDVAVNKDEVFVLRKAEVDFLIRLSDQPSALDSPTVKDMQKLSESPVTLASEISPEQVVRKFGQTAAKMTENIANKVMKEVGEKLQSVPKSIPVWVQSGVSKITKNDLDKSELRVKSSDTNGTSSNVNIKTNGVLNGVGKVVGVLLEESKEDFKNSRNNMETERNGNNVYRSSEDDVSVSSAENVPGIASDASTFYADKSNGISEHVDSNVPGQCSERTGFSTCNPHSVVEINSTKVPSSPVKHSSSLSAFDIRRDRSHDDEIVFSRGKRSKKRHSSKARISVDTISLASSDSVEYAAANTPVVVDNPVVDSSLGDLCPTLQSPEVTPPAVIVVIDAEEEVSDAAAAEEAPGQRDDNLFDIDINLLRKDEPLSELISPGLVSRLSESNLTVEKTDAVIQSNGRDIPLPSSFAIDKTNRDHFHGLSENVLPVDNQNHLLADLEIVLSNDYSIYSVSKSSEIHDSQEIDVTAKLSQHCEQPDSSLALKFCDDHYSEQSDTNLALKFCDDHYSDRVSLQDALEFPAVAEDSLKPTSHAKDDSSPSSSHLPSLLPPNSTSLSVTRTEMTTWHEFSTPARISSISVSSREIWCTDELSRVHYSGFSGQGLHWNTLEQMTAQQIAVSPSGFIIWRLDGGSAFAAKGVSHQCPSGVEWLRVARDVAYIAVDDNEAWYVKTNGEVAMQKDLSRERPCYKSLRVPCSFKLTQISCRSGVICGITSENLVVVRHGVTRLKEQGSEWKVAKWSVLDHIICRLDFGENGTAWVFDLLGRLWYSTGFSLSRPDGDGTWWQVPLNSFLMSESNFWEALKSTEANERRKLSKYLLRSDTGLLSAKLNGLWICPRRGSSLHFCPGNVFGYCWHLVNPLNVGSHKKWSLVSATGQETGQSGLVWLVDSYGSMFCFIPSRSDGVNLISVDPPEPRQMCQSFSASVDVAWCVLDNGHVYIRRQMAGHCLPGYGWDKVDMIQIGWGKLVHVSIGSNTVWGVHSSGAVYLRIGAHHRPRGHILNPAWLKLDNHYDRDLEQVVFKHVFTAPDDSMVWATDIKNCIYIRVGVNDALPIGLSWKLVEGTQAESICLSRGQVFATTPGGDLIRRVGITSDRPQGDYWQTLPGSFNIISVTVKDELWAIDKAGDLYRQEVHLLERPLALENLTEGRLLKCGAGTLEGNDWVVY